MNQEKSNLIFDNLYVLVVDGEKNVKEYMTREAFVELMYSMNYYREQNEIANEIEELAKFCCDNSNYADIRYEVGQFAQWLAGIDSDEHLLKQDRYIYSKEDMLRWASQWNMSFISADEMEKIFEQNKENYGKFKKR